MEDNKDDIKKRVSLQFDTTDKTELRIYNYLDSLGRKKSRKVIEVFSSYLDNVEIQERKLVALLEQQGISNEVYKNMLKAGITTAQMMAMVNPQNRSPGNEINEEERGNSSNSVQFSSSSESSEINDVGGFKSSIEPVFETDNNIKLNENLNESLNSDEDNIKSLPKISAEHKNKLRASMNNW